MEIFIKNNSKEKGFNLNSSYKNTNKGLNLKLELSSDEEMLCEIQLDLYSSGVVKLTISRSDLNQTLRPIIYTENDDLDQLLIDRE